MRVALLPSDRLRRTVATALLIAIVGGIAVTEWMFSFGDNARLGIALALFLSLGIYILISVARLGDTFTRCADVLVLVPLYVLFTASLPWFFLNRHLVMPAVYSVILVLCFWYMRSNGIKFGFMGISRKKFFRYAALGILIGIPSGTIEYLVLGMAPEAPSFQISLLLRDAVYMTFFVAFGEELLFRGLIQREFTAAFGWKWAVFGQAFIFGVMHLTWRSFPELGFTFAVGFVLGLIYHKTKSLTAPIGLHAAGNTMLVAVLPYVLR